MGEWRCVHDPSPWYINDHCFIRDDGGTWHLFGITHEEPFDPFDELSLAHATAPSLLGPWVQQPFALTASTAVGETHLWAPHVVVGDDGRYWMFVCAGGSSPEEYRIHVATSSDCWTWERHPANPVVVDGYQARDPMVLRVDDRWVMYYTATRDNHVVVAVTSRDLVTWSSPVVVLRDPMVGTEAGPTESPFVVAGADGRWYLLVGPDYAGLVAEIVAAGCRTRHDVAAVLRTSTPYRTTRVLVSDDPFCWSPDAVVGTIDAHAAEVVVDEDGAPWVSHCGWGQGGVWLAPLELPGLTG